MTEPAAIDAQVVDIQNDRLHKGFIKVTLHVAVERGALLTDVLGWPTYTTPVPVGLARLNEQPMAAPSLDGDATVNSLPDDASVSDKSRPSVSPEKRLVQQAVLMCTKPDFRLFLEKTFLPPPNRCNNEEQAAVIVRLICEVESRSEIIVGTPAAKLWDRLMGRFSAWDRGLVA